MKVLFITLGCKANQYETNAMEQSFLKSGYDIANDSDVPDICVVNTCSVTNIAERKSRQMIRRMKELNKKAIVERFEKLLKNINSNFSTIVKEHETMF